MEYNGTGELVAAAEDMQRRATEHLLAILTGYGIGIDDEYDYNELAAVFDGCTENGMIDFLHAQTRLLVGRHQHAGGGAALPGDLSTAQSIAGMLIELPLMTSLVRRRPQDLRPLAQEQAVELRMTAISRVRSLVMQLGDRLH